MQTLHKIANSAESTFTLPVKRRVDDRQSIEDRFTMYLFSNPALYPLLVKLCRDVKDRGYNRYSMKAIFERARWHYNIERGDADFTLNNTFTAPFARLIMEQEPDLQNFFHTRERR